MHEALDQCGALLGPLLVADLLAVTGSYRPALLALAVPGVAVLVLLVWLRARVPHPAGYETTPQQATTTAPVGSSARLPRVLWTYAGFSALTMSGFATFGVLSFHLATQNLIPPAAIPLVYAAAMGIDALAALATGYAYDWYGRRVLAALPVLSAVVPVLAFAASPAVAVAGSLVWGAAVGVQESTMRSAIADLVPAARRATGYGIFAAAYGGAAVIGGVLAGALYTYSVPVLIVVTAVIQAGALIGLVVSRPPRPAR